MNNEPLRPDPDRLLEQAAAPHRGKLKVFFGACAGVGKTWAMLAEAQRLRAQVQLGVYLDGLRRLLFLLQDAKAGVKAQAGQCQRLAALGCGIRAFTRVGIGRATHLA